MCRCVCGCIGVQTASLSEASLFFSANSFQPLRTLNDMQIKWRLPPVVRENPPHVYLRVCVGVPVQWCTVLNSNLNCSLHLRAVNRLPCICVQGSVELFGLN